MKEPLDIRFYSYFVQCDESHHEEIYMTIGDPIKSLQTIKKEAENEFYYAVSEGIESEFEQILYQKLAENGYQKVETESGIYYPDPYYMEDCYVQEVIASKEGDGHFNLDIKERINAMRVAHGKEPFPIIRKPVPTEEIEKGETLQNVTLPHPSLTEEEELRMFDEFLQELKNGRDKDGH